MDSNVVFDRNVQDSNGNDIMKLRGGRAEVPFKSKKEYSRKEKHRKSFTDDDESECTCGNPEMGFDCVCEWVALHKGDIEYTCEYCGIYKANKPRCNMCEASENNISQAKG